MSPDAFQFRFQRVLDLRERQQRALEVKLARLDEAVQEARAQVARWEDTREESLRVLAVARQQADLEEAARHSGYLDYVRGRLGSARAGLAQLQREREEMRRRLERVMQACKMLENYRERLRREFQADQEKAEERIIELHSVHKFLQTKRAQ